MPKRMGEILVDRGVIDEELLWAALAKQPTQCTCLGEVLARLGVSRMEIEAAAAERRRIKRKHSREARS